MSDSPLQPSSIIAGVYTVPFKVMSDARGQFMETFRLEWFAATGTDWSRVQSNRSDSRTGVLRGLHYHFQQVDYWSVQKGMIRAGLVDLRSSSPTYMATETIEMGDNQPVGLFIPIGVAHGFVSLRDSTVSYLINNYYDGTDEFGVLWDDPRIALDWAIDFEPTLSPRDAANPLLKDIPASQLPR